MSDYINALIAQGVGQKVQPMNFMDIRRKAAETKLLEQEIQAQPYKQQLSAMGLAVDKKLFEIEKLAFESDAGEVLDTEIQVGKDTYTVKGRAVNVGEVIKEFRKHIDKLNGDAIGWAAEKGVGIKLKGQPKTIEQIKAEAKAKAEGTAEGTPENMKPAKTQAELTRAALRGDVEAQEILKSMQTRAVEVAKATGAAAIEAKMGIVDIEGVARAIVDGRETIENVKNTFGIPVQEGVRARVLQLDPEFNFSKPRIKLSAIKSSLGQQQKQRGMMGSFVKNINKQLTRVDTVMKDVISRVGVRAVDLPLREFKIRFVGSGHEQVLNAYLIEISNEIGKLSTGSAASIRELSTDAQERWAKIHDPNLSLKELKKILDETQTMANMRLDSTDEEIEETIEMLDNINEPRRAPVTKTESGTRFKILKVE